MITTFIKGKYSTFSESEKKVAKYIYERPDDVIHYTITELARFSEASEATVYRLIKKLGFSGYQDFKISLARELSIPKEGSPEDSKKDLKSFVKSVIDSNMNLIKQISSVLDIKSVEKAVKLIEESKRIFFFAVGRSSSVAQSASLNFALLGLSSNYYSDPHAQVMVASSMDEDDIVIGVSHTGTIRDTCKSLQIAHGAGAKTIAITSGINSPITNEADVVLYTATSDPSENSFIVNRIGEFLVLEVIYRCVLVNFENNLKKHFNKLEKALKPKRF
ncbi:MAG: MurR/RpiR family transcriptional regulator [Petrotogales bacterium]